MRGSVQPVLLSLAPAPEHVHMVGDLARGVNVGVGGTAPFIGENTVVRDWKTGLARKRHARAHADADQHGINLLGLTRAKGQLPARCATGDSLQCDPAAQFDAGGSMAVCDEVTELWAGGTTHDPRCCLDDEHLA